MENKDFTEAADMKKTIPWKRFIMQTNKEEERSGSELFEAKRELMCHMWYLYNYSGNQIKIDELWTEERYIMRFDYIEYEGDFYICNKGTSSEFTLQDLTEDQFLICTATGCFYHFKCSEWREILPDVLAGKKDPVKEWEDNWKKKYSDYDFRKHLKRFSA